MLSDGFNSRAHGGRDVDEQSALNSGLKFQFTRPRGARPRAHAIDPHEFQFQFTRPRVARQMNARLPVADRVSIHAPTGGATLAVARVVSREPRFNSRAHGGRDLRRVRRLEHRLVSIHAPTGGGDWA